MKTKLVSAVVVVAIAVFAANQANAKNQTTTKSTAANVANNAAKTNASWLTKLLKGQAETSPRSKTQSLVTDGCDMSKPVEVRNCDNNTKPTSKPPVCNAPPGMSCQEPCIGRDCYTPNPDPDY